MALTEDRNTTRMAGAEVVSVPVEADAVIHAGALVVIEAGYAKPGYVSAILEAVGRANEAVDNTGGLDGDVNVEVQRGIFKFDNDGTNTIVAADLYTTAYIEDDETVGNDATGKSEAGKIIQIDTDGVFVEIR